MVTETKNVRRARGAMYSAEDEAWERQVRRSGLLLLLQLSWPCVSLAASCATSLRVFRVSRAQTLLPRVLMLLQAGRLFPRLTSIGFWAAPSR